MIAELGVDAGLQHLSLPPLCWLEQFVSIAFHQVCMHFCTVLKGFCLSVFSMQRGFLVVAIMNNYLPLACIYVKQLAGCLSARRHN